VTGTHLVLVGFRGAGKTTVGRILARKLGRAFVDLDETIEREQGRSARRIIEDDGEAVLRRLEERALRDLLEPADRAAARPAVVSVGGGVVERAASRRLLGKLGFCVWLVVAERELKRRLRKSTHRPALLAKGPGKQSDVVAEVGPLLRRRRPLYREVADLQIRCGTATPHQLATRIQGTVPEPSPLRPPSVPFLPPSD